LIFLRLIDLLERREYEACHFQPFPDSGVVVAGGEPRRVSRSDVAVEVGLLPDLCGVLQRLGWQSGEGS